MKVVILGAAGKTGRELVSQALAGGHEVTAFVRKEGQLAAQANLKIVIGDARNETDLTNALVGQEAVVSALGTIKAGDKLTVQSTQALIKAAHTTGVTRVLMMSSVLVTSNNQPKGIMKLVLPLMKGMLADKTSGEDILKNSDLDWTIVYATTLDKAPKGGVVRVVGTDEKMGLKNAIARADVATYMLQQLSNPSSIHISPLITVS